MKTPMKMVNGMIVPLTQDELTRREAKRSKPKPQGSTQRDRMLQRREASRPVTRAEFEEMKNGARGDRSSVREL